MSEFDISIDPGTNATGVCVWVKGKPISSKVPTLRPPKDLAFEQKLLWLRRRLVSFFRELTGTQHTISRIGIEQFEAHHAQRDNAFPHAAKAKIMKCSAIQGMLIGLADDWCKEIVHPNKKQIKKSETALLAHHYGVNGSKDALDAFHLGIIAGFDRRTS